jgi:eukaryotic translation initiation factor 2C
MQDVALSFLGAPDLRDLNISDGQQLARLKKFFEGIFITFTHREGKKKIGSIVPHAQTGNV